MKWKIINPKEQEVIVGLVGVQDRIFKDRNCITPERVDSTPFTLLKDGKRMRDITNNDHRWMHSSESAGFMDFTKLPAGTYELHLLGARKRQTAPMEFVVQTFATDKNVKIVQI